MPLNDPGREGIGRSLDAAAGQLAHSLRRNLMTKLHGAPARGELSLHYQPRVGLPDGTPLGAEALLRWSHPMLGQVPPDRFIPLAEASGLILPLGGRVLREAAREAATWPAGGIVSVNVSPRQVSAGVLTGQVDAALGESGLDPARLELELTESLALADGEEARRMLGALRDRGIGLALDDFGTGHGSLARLRRLPFSTMKLDRSFIGKLPGDAGDAAILRAVRQLATALRLRLVAEGVERPEQRDFLVELGCDEAQGWLFGRPMAPPALRAHWRRPGTRWRGAAEPAARAVPSAAGPASPSLAPA
jgi:EAL domain-containing protein (putative c-di-GMP-specific phosphodiesterase class I)